MEEASQFQVTFRKNYVYVELKGLISSDCLLDVSRYLQSSDEYTAGMPEIWEMTQGDLSEVDPDSVTKAIKELEVFWEGYATCKVAIVSGKNINMGHAYLFRELYRRDVVQAFESLAEAEKWIEA